MSIYIKYANQIAFCFDRTTTLFALLATVITSACLNSSTAEDRRGMSLNVRALSDENVFDYAETSRCNKTSFTQIVKYPDLEILTIGTASHGDKIADVDAKILQSLHRLKKLSISSHQLGNEGFSYLCQIKSLEHLSVSFSELDDEGLAHIQGLRNLTELTLDCAIDGKGLAHLAKLPKLSKLDLYVYPNIDLTFLPASLQLSSLRVLNDVLEQAEMEVIAKSSQLEHFSFEGKLKTASPQLQLLTQLPRLSFLAIDSPQCDDNCVDSINCPALAVVALKGTFSDKAITRFLARHKSLTDLCIESKNITVESLKKNLL